MKKLFLLMTLVICALGANAQNTKVVTGAVIDKNGNPLPNALVEATGGAENVTTEADGSFRIEVPFWLKSVTARYAGFQSKKVKLRNKSQVVFEMKPQKGAWFLDAAYSISGGDAPAVSRAGLMAGYLGNWGGYTKVMVPFGGEVEDFIPSVTLGGIKQVAKPVYLYLGVGYTLAFSDEYEYVCEGHYEIDGSYYVDYEYDYYWTDCEDGAMFEAGAIFKFNKFNFSVGYAYSTSFCCYENHSLQLSVGYCF